MTSRHLAAPLRRLLSTLCLAAAPLLAAVPAAAMPVSAQIDNLPPGLTVFLETRRCVVTDHNGDTSSMIASLLPLNEGSTIVYDTVTTSTGLTVLRPRTITRYSGQTDVDPDPNVAGMAACDRSIQGAEVLRFALSIQGQAADGASSSRNLHLGQTFNRVNPVALRRTLFGSSALLNPPTQVARGTRLQFDVQHSNPFTTGTLAATQAPSLEFRRAVPLPGSLFNTVQVTRVFVDPQGRKCITAASGSTRCTGSTPLQFGMLVHGGVVLDVAATRAAQLVNGSERSVFVLALDNSFAAGDLTLRASADDRDPLRYLVDGVATELDLLEWRAGSVPLRVL